MFSNNLFLDSTADRISLGLMLEELYMLNLYFDIVNHVPVFFLYISDILCSYMLGVKIPYSYKFGLWGTRPSGVFIPGSRSKLLAFPVQLMQRRSVALPTKSV